LPVHIPFRLAIQIVNQVATIDVHSISNIFRIEFLNNQTSFQISNLIINDLSKIKTTSLSFVYNLRVINITKETNRQLGKDRNDNVLVKEELKNGFSVFFYSYKSDNEEFDFVGICDSKYANASEQLSLMYYYHHAIPNSLVAAFNQFLIRLIYPPKLDSPFAVEGSFKKVKSIFIGFHIGLSQQITKSKKALFCIVPITNAPSNITQLIKKDMNNDLRFLIREQLPLVNEIKKIIVAGYSGGGVHAIDTWTNHKAIIDELYLLDPSDAAKKTIDFVSIKNIKNIINWLVISSDKDELISSKKLRIIWGLESRVPDYFNLAKSIDGKWKNRFDFNMQNNKLPIYVYPNEKMVLQDGFDKYFSYHLALLPIIDLSKEYDSNFYKKLIQFDDIQDKGTEKNYLSKLTGLYWNGSKRTLITATNLDLPNALPIIPQLGKVEFTGFTLSHWILSANSQPNKKAKITETFQTVVGIINSNFTATNPYILKSKQDITLFISSMANDPESFFNAGIGLSIRHQWPVRGGFWDTNLSALAMSNRGVNGNDGDFKGHFYMLLRDSNI
jgi:hypothetical protein